MLIVFESGTLRRAVLATFACARRVVMRIIIRPGTLSGGIMNEENEVIVKSPVLKK